MYFKFYGKITPHHFRFWGEKILQEMGQYRDKIMIPRSAVLWTGERSVVSVKLPGTDEPVFRMREITLGPLAGDHYIVENGLMEGEEIVTQGTFSVDAAAQLEGKPSMMNPEGEKMNKGSDTMNKPMGGMKM